MNKLSQLSKQISSIQSELRRTKQFFKSSSSNFSSFYSNMKSSLKTLNNCDIFNDIQYMNYSNIEIINHFVQKISMNASIHSDIHLSLKEEGKKLKLIQKQISKYKTKDESPNELISESTKLICEIRNEIKKSFDAYIETLCSFADTKTQLEEMKQKCDETFRKDQPIFNHRLNTAFGFQGGIKPQMNLNSNFNQENEDCDDQIDKVAHFLSTAKKKKTKSLVRRQKSVDNPEYAMRFKSYDGDNNIMKSKKNIFKMVDTNIVERETNEDIQQNKDNDSVFQVNEENEFSVHNITDSNDKYNN